MMAADAFATVNTAHNVGSPHDPQLGSVVNGSKSAIFGDPCHPSTPGSSLSSAAAIVLGLSNLGLNGRTDPTFTGGASMQAIPFASSVGQGSGVGNDRADGGDSGVSVGNGGISKQEDIVRSVLWLFTFKVMVGGCVNSSAYTFLSKSFFLLN